MIVYFVRHGQSEGNIKGFFQTLETPLTDTGIKQAEAVAKRLKGITFDLIYASPMLRTQQTAQIINKGLNAPIELWENIKEIRIPSEIQGKSRRDDRIQEISDLINENFHIGNYKYSDEETPDELIERAGSVLEHLEKNHDDETILCVSHSTAIKAIIAKVIFGNSLTPSLFKTFRHHVWAENTGITICEYTKERGWTLNTWNDTLHI